MDFLQNITSHTLKESVNVILRTNDIPLDSLWLDYEVLKVALRQGNIEVANELLDIGCTVNKYKDLAEPSETPIHYAVELRNIELVKKLLEKGASILANDSDSNSPCHSAFLLKYDDIVDTILHYIRVSSSYEDSINKFGLTHLHIACARGNFPLIYRFQQVGSDFNCVVSNESEHYPGYTCLQFACESKCLETVSVVVKATNLFGHCLDKRKEDFKRKKYLESFNRHEITWRHEYSYASNILINKKNKFMSEFQNACFQGDLSNVQIFLENGEYANICMSRDATACSSFRPLHFAVEAHKNRQKIVELLLQRGADLSLINGYCMTPLHSALYSDDFRLPEKDDTLKFIYEAVEEKEDNPMDAFGLTYFHAAIALNDMEMVKKLIGKGEGDCKSILPNCRNFSKYTPLHFAVKYGHEEMAKMFIERGANVNANEDENQFETPLQTAINYGQCQMVEFLLARGANAKVVWHPMNWTTLHLVVERFGHHEDENTQLLRIVNTLIQHGTDVDAVDSYGRTAKRFSAQCSKDEMTRALSGFVREDNTQRSTPLQLAMSVGNFRKVRRLLKQGKEDVRVVEPSSQRTILHLLAERLKRSDNEGFKLVDEIVENGVDVDARDRYGFTALHVACSNNRPHCGLVEGLLEAGADVNLKVNGRVAMDFLRDNCNEDVDLVFLVISDHLDRLNELGFHIDPENMKICKLIKYREKCKGEDTCMRTFHKDDGSWYQVKNMCYKSMRDKKEKREQEVSAMKQDMLTDEVSMYDYARMNGEKAVGYLDNEKLQGMVNDDEVPWVYGIFGFRIRAVYRMSEKVAEKKTKTVKRRGEEKKSAGGKRKKI